jgi:hypothetical protein
MTDPNATAQRMRSLFKRIYGVEGVVNTIMLIVTIPLTFLRDYTIPVGELAAWSRKRTAI